MAGSVSAFRVSLNGQQYGAPLTLGVHIAPTVGSISRLTQPKRQPKTLTPTRTRTLTPSLTPKVSSLSPASGPFGGGTRVDVRGAGFDQRGDGTGQLAEP
jgi:hypothetical protein